MRGKAPGPKPTLTDAWRKMRFVGRPGDDGTGEKVGYVKHFLDALGLSSLNPGRRARTWNKLLTQAGLDLLEEVELEEAGKTPWVGTKAVFRFLYDQV